MKLKHLFVCLALIAPASLHADILSIGEAPKVITKTGAPKAGMSMNAVRLNYGEPRETRVAAGLVTKKNPRITVWKYAQSTVYFENNYVIHTVVHR